MKNILIITLVVSALTVSNSFAQMGHGMMRHMEGKTVPSEAEVKEFTLTVNEISWEILPGVKVKAAAFNGRIPGPEIRVREWDKVRIKVINQLKEPTAIHWHGVDVPYNMDGVPGVTQEAILPGKEFI